MFNISVSVTNQDEARTAADLFDFLAERLAPGAAPTQRRARGKRAETPVGDTTERPVTAHNPDLAAGFTGGRAAQTDPAALYATLAGGLPADLEGADPTQAEPVVSEPVVAVQTATVDVEALRVTVRAKAQSLGGLWFRTALDQNGLTGVPLSQMDATGLGKLMGAAE